MAKSESQLRFLLRGASDRKSGPKLTASPAKASHVRDPKTGKLYGRWSAEFQKWESRRAAR